MDDDHIKNNTECEESYHISRIMMT